MVKTGQWISEGWELVKQDLGMHVLMALVVTIISGTWILYGPIMCGYYYVFFKKMRYPGQPVVFEDLFRGFDVFVPALVGGLLYSIFVSLGLLACLVGAIVVSALLLFVLPLIIDRRMDFWPAITTSYETAKQDWLGFSFFVLVTGLIWMAGSLVFGVGVYFTMPIAMGAMAVAYRDVFGLAPVEAAQGPEIPAAPLA